MNTSSLAKDAITKSPQGLLSLKGRNSKAIYEGIPGAGESDIR